MTKKRLQLKLFLVILLLLVFYLSFAAYQALHIAQQLAFMQTDVRNIEITILEKDRATMLLEISKQLDTFDSRLNKVYKSSLWFRPWWGLPIVGSQLEILTSLSHRAMLLTSEAKGFIAEHYEVAESLITKDSLSYSALNKEEKQAIAKAIYTSEQTMGNVGAVLEGIQNDLAGINWDLLQKIKPDLPSDIPEKVSQIQVILEEYSPYFAYVPYLIGYPEPQYYLILLQNNHELRPTGGFIGTYGVLTIDALDVDMFLDNIYNLDAPANAWLTEAPPEPMAKYLNITQWHLRDANWEPDFPSAAQKAIDLYHEERGPIERFDGVLSLTPDVIAHLLSITGPITVDGETFNENNLVEVLEERVGREFLELGIDESNRKDIIASLAEELRSRLFSLGTEAIQEYVKNDFLAHLKRKDVLLYSQHETLAHHIDRNNWGGQIQNPPEGDYLYVVDANLGSLKTDPYIKRNYSYSLTTNDAGELIATLHLDYTNTAGFTWKTTRYRNYVRVYTPQGSELLDTQGAMDMDRSSVPGEVMTYEAHNKTVFATFIAIEPKKQGRLTFTYKLPDNTRIQSRKNDLYKLYVQHQPGRENTALDFKIDVNSAIKSYSPQPTWETVTPDDIVDFSLPFTQDEMILVEFE